MNSVSGKGWCGTCIKNAEPGEYGYCSPLNPNPETDEMIVKVKRAQVNFAFTFDATSTYLFRETGYTIESYFSLVVRCMQCGQIGQILKSFDDKFSLKIAEIYGL